MAKKKDSKKSSKKLVASAVRAAAVSGDGVGEGAESAARSRPVSPISRKEFEDALEPLQVELVHLQLWVQQTGAKICVLFEGRDTAGKGGVIKRITERVSPRVFRVVALPAPTEREKSQIYIQRYMPHLPAAGEVVLFDRSWYNRAGVERVMGFATEVQVASFLRVAPEAERIMIESGLILIKYWLEVSQAEQTRRFQERIDDPRKTWKLTAMDLETHRRYYDYSRARDAMFAATDTAISPWYVVPSDDQRPARLNCIAHLLSRVPYEEVKQPTIKLPRSQPKDDYVPSDHPLRFVPQRY